MSTNVTLHAGHDIAYLTSGQGSGGGAGAMSYYTAAGEPPGEWAGKGAAAPTPPISRRQSRTVSPPWPAGACTPRQACSDGSAGG